MRRMAVAGMFMALLAGCAGPVSYGVKGVATGAAIGGGVGALAGWKLANPALGAAVGAGIGALTGGIIGTAIDGAVALASPPQTSRAPQAPNPGPPPAFPMGAAVPTGWAPVGYRADPTAGEVVNASRYQVEVLIDPHGDAGPGGNVILLGPFQSRPISLDVGGHRVLGAAFAATQFGPRLVGRFDTVIHINPRHSWWRLTMRDSDFR